MTGGIAPTRIAMWSGPRNVSTALMRSFENRPDTVVSDEPFYAAYLRAADRLGAAPPVIDGRDLLADPSGVLGRLCKACGIGFDAAMLAWPAGRRASDGVWAPAWYDRVEASTGFEARRAEATFDDLPDALKPIAEAARPLYERLKAHRLK